MKNDPEEWVDSEVDDVDEWYEPEDDGDGLFE